MSAHKINKMAVYATVMYGMIRDHPGLVRAKALSVRNERGNLQEGTTALGTVGGQPETEHV